MTHSAPLWKLSATDLSALLDAGKITSRQIVTSCLERIKEMEPAVHAFLEVFFDEVLHKADQSDERRRNGCQLSTLDGIPIAIKDNFLYRDHLCTCASQMLKNFRAPYTASVVERLLSLGMPILGRMNMDEFAMGCTTETSIFGPSRNPSNTDYVAGGSSGGSAAAVACGMIPYALGSDTGGSIRQPAGFCGAFGVKPAYGTISRYGLVAFASSLDTVGIFARSSADAALLLPLICTTDAKDSTCASSLWQEKPRPQNTKIRLAVPKESFELFSQTEVRERSLFAVRTFQEAKADVCEISIPSLRFSLAAYHILSACEASSNLARYDGIRYGHRPKTVQALVSLYLQSRGEGFGQEVKQRISLGCFALSSGQYDAYYGKANEIRTEIQNELNEILEEYDAILMPTSPMAAYPIGSSFMKPEEKYACDALTVPANLAGLPAISVPFGNNSEGLPIGIQLIGPKDGLYSLLELSKILEEGAKSI